VCCQPEFFWIAIARQSARKSTSIHAASGDLAIWRCFLRIPVKTIASLYIHKVSQFRLPQPDCVVINAAESTNA